MSSVFGHGRLRLYLLKLLDEEPRHGYDMIRLLENRFMGVYAPSAGTIYPRLARMEEEGLVEHEVLEGKKVYRLTDAGRSELAERQDELAALEQDIDRSVRDLAREVREDVRSSLRDLREELKEAAREVREAERTRDDAPPHSSAAWSEFTEPAGWADAKEAMREASKTIKEETKRAFEENAYAWQGQWQKEWHKSWSGETKSLVKELMKTAELLRNDLRRVVKESKGNLDEEVLREVQVSMRATHDQVKSLLLR